MTMILVMITHIDNNIESDGNDSDNDSATYNDNKKPGADKTLTGRETKSRPNRDTHKRFTVD